MKTDGLARYLTRSTLKREYALVLTVWWMVMESYMLFREPLGQQIASAPLSTCTGLFSTIGLLAAGAFGADFVAKQTTIAGPPQNTETTVAATVTDDTATVTTTTEQKP